MVITHGDTESLTIESDDNLLQYFETKVRDGALEDFEPEKERLEGLGIKVQETEHAWIHVRSLYFADPEGNTLEFVAYDESVR